MSAGSHFSATDQKENRFCACVWVHVCTDTCVSTGAHIYEYGGRGHLWCHSPGAVPFFQTLRPDLTETRTLLLKLCWLASKAQGPVLSLLPQLCCVSLCPAFLMWILGTEPRFSSHICARRQALYQGRLIRETEFLISRVGEHVTEKRNKILGFLSMLLFWAILAWWKNVGLG